MLSSFVLSYWDARAAKAKFGALLMSLLIIASDSFCQVQVSVDFTTQRSIGGISTLDRNVYFNMHHGIPDNEFDEKELRYLYQDLKIGNGGRSFSGVGGLAHKLANIPDENAMKQAGSLAISKFDNRKLPHASAQLIVTEHPRNVFDPTVDPAAVAQYTAHYFKYYYGGNKALPKYYEPINEPFVHAQEFGKDVDGIIGKMSEYHALVAQKIHEQVPGLKVVGYASAWPEYDYKDFEIWNSRMKKFMDIAGKDMDFLSFHLYDGVNIEGEIAKRSGSNSEAIMDLVETYSNIKWGFVKPVLISEFGITGKGWGENNLESRNALTVNSMHNLVMGFMERPEVIKLTIPFITGKSKWRLTGPNSIPYQWSIAKPSKNSVTGWEFSTLTQFYDFWKNVAGNRVVCQSSDPDIMVRSFIKDGNAFVAFKNLEEENSVVHLDVPFSKMNVRQIVQKTWNINPDSSSNYTVLKLDKLPSSVIVPKNGAVLFEIDYQGKASKIVSQTLDEKKYYSKSYIQTIKKDTPLTFEVNNVTSGASEGELRISLAREHQLSLHPQVLLNGVALSVPHDWAGYDQKSRHGFFGTLVIPVQGDRIQEANQVEITFNDQDGGRVSAVILNTKTIKKR